jgi:hypothetical protein
MYISCTAYRARRTTAAGNSINARLSIEIAAMVTYYYYYSRYNG